MRAQHCVVRSYRCGAVSQDSGVYKGDFRAKEENTQMRGAVCRNRVRHCTCDSGICIYKDCSVLITTTEHWAPFLNKDFVL
ncbi:hypothetical protein FKM82_028693 [Ascaphus truei]